MEAHCYHEYNRMEREHWWFQARREILGSVLRRLTRGRPRPRILDIGCGTGESVRHLSQFGRVVALDFSDLALTFCRHKKLGNLVQADAVRLPFADGSFDLICGLDILEHLADEQAALAEIRRVCRPGGQILLTVPALPMLWSRHDVANHHKRRYRKSQLARVLSEANLDCQWLTYFNTFLFAPAFAVRILGRLLRRPVTTENAQMDLACTTGGFLGPLLRRLFAFEAPLVGRVPLPVGVSLLCVATNTAPAPTRNRTIDRAAWARSILARFIRPPRLAAAQTAPPPAIRQSAIEIEPPVPPLLEPQQQVSSETEEEVFV